MNGTSKRRGGFTLVELLAVVGIIAVVAAVAIPVFSGSISKARAAACMAHRRSLLGELTVSSMMDEDVEAKYQGLKDTFSCPSHGLITYRIEADGAVSVNCSIHTYTFGMALEDALEKISGDGFSLPNKGRIDSTHVTEENVIKVKEILADAGINLDDIGAKSWAILKTADGKKTQIIWSDQDVTEAGMDSKAVRVICYTLKTDQYCVGYSNVNKLDGTEQNVLAKGAEGHNNGYGNDKSNNKSSEYTDFDSAYAHFLMLAPTKSKGST